MSNIKNFSDIRKKQDSDDNANRAAGNQTDFYAGGNDQRGGGSGLNVIDPKKSDKKVGGSIFDQVVERAQAPQEMDGENPPSNGTSRKITIYKNGFTIDDGPIRDLTSPESIKFMEQLKEGILPVELRPITLEKGKGPIALDVRLDDKRSEDYIPPAYVAFSSGTTLGGTRDTSTSYIITPEILATLPPLTAIDESKPTTTLQVRTHDGRKLKLKLNHSSTVLDLISLFNNQGAGTDSFTLSSGFPPKELTDPNQTLTEAGLISAAIQQKKV